MQDFIPYGRQWIDESDIKAVEAVLKSDFLTQGPEIELFEKEIKKITGAKYCVAVSNATQGLHIAASALEITDKESEGITTPITFAASANCLITNKLKPVFADIDPVTYNISPTEIEKKITKKTRVLIPVDFAGRAVDIDSIKKLANRHNLFIIEDAAHAIGSYYSDGKPIGCCHKADMTVFSFHPVKTITCGEGGAITTNNESIYKKLLKLRTIGITKDAKQMTQNPGPWYYEVQMLSGNNRMTDIQAALGRNQLSKLSMFKKRRNEIITKYNDAFLDKPNITIPYKSNEIDTCFHLYVLQMDFKRIGKTRKQIMEELKQKRVGTQVHYIPVNSMPYYEKYYGKYNAADYPASDSYYNKALSIPLYPAMTDNDVQRVINSILEVINGT